MWICSGCTHISSAASFNWNYLAKLQFGDFILLRDSVRPGFGISKIASRFRVWDFENCPSGFHTSKDMKKACNSHTFCLEGKMLTVTKNLTL